MHSEAYQWVAAHATADPVAVLDIGGRNINGSVRGLFPNADPYVSLDVVDGEGVDVVADAATWTPDRQYDVVVCCEVFEHTAAWPDICVTAYRACRPSGLLILTMAGPGRAPHSAVDGGSLRPGEYYANVRPGSLDHSLAAAGWCAIHVDQLGSDVRATAEKPTAAI